MQILITGAFALTPEFQKELEANGLNVTFHKDEREQVEHPEQYEAVVCNGLFLYNDIRKFANLKTVQLTSAGYDRMPMDYAEEHGIKVYNAKGVYSVPMAEFAITGILDLYKQSRYFYRNQMESKWEKHRGLRELSGAQVCIVGCGDVGREIAKRLKAFDCHITGVNRTVREEVYFDEIRPLEQMEKTVAKSDIVILAIGLTDTTKELVRNYVPSAMKRGSILVNVARGSLVEEKKVLNELKSGRLTGAVLDVFEEEPLREASELWGRSDVILTPHNSFVGEWNRKRLNILVLNHLIQ